MLNLTKCKIGECFSLKKWAWIPSATKQYRTSAQVNHRLLTDPENKGVRQQGVNFDTLGCWNNRLELPILVEQSIRRGKPIPRIPIEEIGCATLLGRRKVNEDRYVVEELNPNLLYFALFDGHCGSYAADFVSRQMKKHIMFLLQHTNKLHDVLKQSFIDINNQFARYLFFNHLRSDLFNSGTTATVCLLRNSVQLVIGHVGDSGAILCRDGQVMRLTKNHEPDDKEEALRIKKCGGFITQNSLGSSHVNGRLAMTRSIGDMELKHYGVTALPDIRSVEIKHGKDAFLVLMTDGLTFALSDREIINTIGSCNDPAEAAQLITDQALQFGSEDNTTAIVIPFGAWGKYRSSSTSTQYAFGRQLCGGRYW